jgi:hypothetical protein
MITKKEIPVTEITITVKSTTYYKMTVGQDNTPAAIDFGYDGEVFTYRTPADSYPIFAESLVSLGKQMKDNQVVLMLSEFDYKQINFDLCSHQEWAQQQQAELMASTLVHSEISKLYDLKQFYKSLGVFSGVIGAYRYGYISIEDAIDCINYFRTNHKGTDPNDFTGQLKTRLDFLLSINYISQDEYNTVWSSQN